MEDNIYDPVVLAGIEPDTHFLQEIEVRYTPREDVKFSGNIKTSAEAYKYIRLLFLPFLSHHEEVWILLLNQATKLIGMSQVAKGGIDFSVVDIRIIFQTLLITHSVRFVLIHNHPAGSLRPSRQDEMFTKKVKQACEILNIQLLDHLIIGAEGYFSFADEGLL